MTVTIPQSAATGEGPRRPRIPAGTRVRVSVIDESPVVMAGLTAMLRPYARRVRVLAPELHHPRSSYDVALCDPFLEHARASAPLDDLLAGRQGPAVLAYSWLAGPEAVDRALARGCAGFVSKESTAEQVVRAVERVAAGERGVQEPQPDDPETGRDSGWRGQEQGLSRREGEVFALICEGATNQDIAERAYLSPNTVKSYIRTAYRKAGVTRRSEAVRWGIQHGMLEGQERPAS